MADQVIDRQLAPINKPIKHNYCNFKKVLSRICFSNNKIWQIKQMCMLDSQLQRFSWSVNKENITNSSCYFSSDY